MGPAGTDRAGTHVYVDYIEPARYPMCPLNSTSTVLRAATLSSIPTELVSIPLLLTHHARSWLYIQYTQLVQFVMLSDPQVPRE